MDHNARVGDVVVWNVVERYGVPDKLTVGRPYILLHGAGAKGGKWLYQEARCPPRTHIVKMASDAVAEIPDGFCVGLDESGI